MTSLVPAETIKLSPDKLMNLEGVVGEILDDLERENSRYFDNIAIWWRNYEAVPRQRVKNFPFKNASNIIVPLAQMMVDANTARTHAAVYSAGWQLWQARTEDESKFDEAKNMARYINWQANGNDFNFKIPSYDWIFEATAIGSSVLVGNWREDVRNVHVGQRGKVKTAKVRFNRGPILESIPRESLLWDTRFNTAEAPIVAQQMTMGYNQLAFSATADPSDDSWILENVEAMKAFPGVGGPGQQVRDEKARHDLRDRSTLSASNDHDIRVVHLDYSIFNAAGIDAKDFNRPKGKPSLEHEGIFIPIVATYHRNARKIARLSAEPYNWPDKPFFDIYYKKKPGRGQSDGLVKRLEGLQSGMTTIFNQGIDSQTRANSIWMKTNNAQLRSTPIDPQTMLWDPSMKSVEVLNLPGADFGNFQLLNTAQAMAERITGQADPAFGRETRMGGHPAPATSTLALMNNADILSGPMRDQISEQLGRAGQFIATLDQQFEANEDGKIERVLGQVDAEHISSFMFPVEPIPGNYHFNIRGLSADLNPESLMSRAIQVQQVNQNYWSLNTTASEALVALLGSQMPEELKQIQLQFYTQFLSSSAEAHRDFLEAASVDDIEKFIFILSGEPSRAADALSNFAGQSRELAGPSAPPQQLGVGGNGADLQQGAPVPPGVFG